MPIDYVVAYAMNQHDNAVSYQLPHQDTDMARVGGRDGHVHNQTWAHTVHDINMIHDGSIHTAVALHSHVYNIVSILLTIDVGVDEIRAVLMYTYMYM